MQHTSSDQGKKWQQSPKIATSRSKWLKPANCLTFRTMRFAILQGFRVVFLKVYKPHLSRYHPFGSSSFWCLILEKPHLLPLLLCSKTLRKKALEWPQFWYSKEHCPEVWVFEIRWKILWACSYIIGILRRIKCKELIEWDKTTLNTLNSNIMEYTYNCWKQQL